MNTTAGRARRPAAIAAACAAAAITLGACGRGGPARADDGLARDLEQAALVAAAPELGGRTRFVSSIELGAGAPAAGPTRTTTAARGAAPRRRPRAERRTPTRVASRTPAPVHAAAPAEEVAEAPASAEPSSAPAAVPAPEPTARAADPEPVASGPSADEGDAPATAPADEGRRGRRRGGIGWGTVIGGIAGVVIRGGSVGDDDHCERDLPRGRRGGSPAGSAPGGVIFPTRGGSGVFTPTGYPRY
jgi:hypothetical protein